MPRRERAVPILLACNLISFSVIAVLLLTGFGGKGKARFTELDIERLNVIGTNGKPVLVLANRRMIPGPSMNGKSYPRSVSEGRELLSGMIFFNEEGDEVGGLVFNGFKKGAGPEDFGAIEHLSFDQWKQNQVLALQYNDHSKSRRAGLMVWDRPTGVPLDVELDRIKRMPGATPAERESLKREADMARARGDSGAQRLFVGSRDRTAEVQLSDTKGRARARLYVGPDDAPHLDFLDGDGKVVATYPPL
jgi:hypothetical protein